MNIDLGKLNKKERFELFSGLKDAKSDYNVWDHVKNSLKHLDEEERKINNAWLDKNKPVSQDAI